MYRVIKINKLRKVTSFWLYLRNILYAVWWLFSSIPAEPAASIFRVEEKEKCNRFL
jgi:hypothetical protein